MSMGKRRYVRVCDLGALEMIIVSTVYLCMDREQSIRNTPPDQW
jgi:hypothetical protein